MQAKRPLGVVIPWFGLDQGGAERQARQVAHGLAGRGRAVEVLTTRCRSFLDDWSVNHHATGTDRDGGVVVRRFTLDARDAAAFDRVNERLMRTPPSDLRPGVSPVPPPDARTYVENSINSSALLEHLRARAEDYAAFIFIPYLYGTTLNGLPLVARKAYLQPCLHDESYAYLPQVAEAFRLAKGILFNSEGEARLATRLYGPGVIGRSFVVEEGIELPPYDETRMGGALPPRLKGERFVLYLGRREAAKNTDLLVSAYRRFKGERPESRLKLVLAGPGRESFDDPAGGLFDLGAVGEVEKASLIKNCLALFQPSRNESYSRAIMEAWSYGRPVAAARTCLATATAVAAARGGWLAGTDREWADLFSAVDSAEEAQLDALGARGRLYAEEHADWSRVIDRYEQVLGEEGERRAQARARTAVPAAVHQILPDLAYGDAISNQALAIRDRIRRLGYRSEIYVKNLDTRVACEAREFDPSLVGDGDGLVYHHSIGSGLTAAAVGHRGPKCLVYHNITPAEFFLPFRPGFAWMLERGRAELPRLARHFAVSAGDSLYNSEELARCGFQDPGVLPIVVDPDRWNVAPDPALMDRLQDGMANLLYVGRVAPNKRQDELLLAFSHYLRADPDARMIIAGEGKAFDPYYRRVERAVRDLGLAAHVMLTGQVSDSQLAAFYRTAHLYWSMSEHEGFCVPVVEAMWFDVPVLAYESSAVPETLGGAGVTFKDKKDLSAVAAEAVRLVRDGETRERVLAAQSARRKDFLPGAVWPSLERLLGRIRTEA